MNIADPEIENRDSFTVLGIQSRVKQGSETSELFAGIWQRFEKEREVLESLALIGTYYGVNFPTHQKDLSEYLAGMTVAEDATVPDGWVKRQVPGGDYAVFECPVESIGFCYQHIFTKWLAGASVTFYPEHPVFEEYPEMDSTLNVRIHIPVKKNE
jgi:predicted transcriptional regulator YdeE